jgi:AcrR family transcriptional regulator
MNSNITVLNTGDSKDRRSQRTRETIVRTAERLFAAHGVEGVSLNTITTAAHQNNRNAVQYHFGNKKGLLQAIFDKHSPNVMQRRHDLIDQYTAQGLPMPLVAAKAMIIPLAEKLEDSDGGAHYIHISAELNATNTLNYFLNSEVGLRLQRETKLAELVAEHMNHIPTSLIMQRFMLIAGFVFHSLSEHERIRNSDAKLGILSDTELLVNNLSDATAGLLSAGASEESLNLVNSLKTASAAR